MTTVMDFRGMVDRATSDYLLAPDWGVNMQICDVCRSQEAVIRIIASRVRERLSNKNTHVVFLALELIGSLFQNVRGFAGFVAGYKAFLPAVLKVVPKRLRDPNYKPFVKTKAYTRQLSGDEWKTYDKVFDMIRQWSNDYGGAYHLYTNTYRDLCAKNVQFPEQKTYIPPDRNGSISKRLPDPNARKGNDGKRNAASAPSASSSSSSSSFQAANGAFVDAACNLLAEHSIVLTDYVTESSPQTDLPNDEVVKALMAMVKEVQGQVIGRLQLPATQSNPTLLDELFRANDLAAAAVNYFSGVAKGTKQRYAMSSSALAAEQKRQAEQRRQALAEQEELERKQAAEAHRVAQLQAITSSVPKTSPMTPVTLAPPSADKQKKPRRTRKSSASHSSVPAYQPAEAPTVVNMGLDDLFSMASITPVVQEQPQQPQQSQQSQQPQQQPQQQQQQNQMNDLDALFNS
jgi:hypothetical protein